MNKLSKAQIEKRSELVAKLQKYREEANNAVTELNDKITELYDALEGKLTTLNEAREEAASFVREVAEEMSAHYDEKSEKWQEGDKGQAYGSWKDSWDDMLSNLEEEIEVEKPDEIDELNDAETLIDEFSSLEEAPE